LAAGQGASQLPPQPPATTLVFDGTVLRFAVPECVPRPGDEAAKEACRTLTQVLRNDLKFELDAQRFVPDSLIGAIAALDPDAPKFKDWESIGATHLVVTEGSVNKGQLTVELRLHFVANGQTMLSRTFTAAADNPRVVAHQGSDEIMALTQFKGVARSKIAFVTDRDATKERRAKEVYIMDYDGWNPRAVTVNRSINILPAWSPDGRSLAYVSYRQGPAMLFRAVITEGKSVPNLSGERGGQAFAPTFSPDGKRLAFASSRTGNTDVWVMNEDGSGARNLTSNRASDTAPCWSPTGQELAFTSDRTGTPQLWVMDADGLNVRRLSTIGNYNDACAWSPSRDRSEVAYTSRIEGGFEIAVLDIASGQVRQITQGRGSCEYPTWAPNGRHLAFSCNRGGTWQITVSDRDGRTVQTLAAGPGNNVQPDWGPGMGIPVG
jgi:TolB protein